jgi:hypothetical protein
MLNISLVKASRTSCYGQSETATRQKSYINGLLRNDHCPVYCYLFLNIDRPIAIVVD